MFGGFGLGRPPECHLQEVAASRFKLCCGIKNTHRERNIPYLIGVPNSRAKTSFLSSIQGDWLAGMKN
jgi:hypothetical protein